MTKPLHLRLLAASLALLLLGCGEGESPEPTVTVEDAAPDPSAAPAEVSFLDLGGEALSLADLRGEKVVLNYWATWCAPCIEEIPALLNARDELADEGFVFLLASDESLEEIRGFLEEREFGEGNFVKLEGSFAGQGVSAVPSTILYDSQGREVDTWLGAYEWDSPEMLEELRQAQ